MSILNSGGADGADSVFGECAKLIGHEVRHYAFQGMQSKCSDLKILNPGELYQADQFLDNANVTLKRRFPGRSEYVNNLLRRDYWQVKDTKAVFAVAPLEKNMVKGGTGWAVQMAIDLRVPTLYLFDLNTDNWHQWFYSLNAWEIVLGLDIIRPDHFSVYTGIGSRDLTKQGEWAIEWLYGIDNRC